MLLIQGHPHGGGSHLCHALAEAYGDGVLAAGGSIDVLDIGLRDIPLLRDPADWQTGPGPAFVAGDQALLRKARHVTIIFPLWMGGMPAALRAWMEQVLRGGFAIEETDHGRVRKFKGVSARLIVTMGMPTLFYRWYFGQPGTKLLRRSILGFAGVGPIEQTLIGRVDHMPPDRFQSLKEKMQTLAKEDLARERR